ncbi:BapA/Bap/LapF family large adhesin [Sphingomonas parapaucimobilis]|uniref:BapA/Bap/LapF family large adhesin n=1 Tax=Sphingomonas parapaucimobilis TaxID=28213 RepID=UPI00321BBC5D
MQTEIIAKATGTTTTTSANVIELSAPSVVRMNIDRAQVATMEREGNDLIIRLTDGQTIRIDHFYDQQQGKISDLVLRDDQGSQWLANPSASGAGRFRAITDLDDLMGAATTGEGGGSSFVLPAILGVAGVGGLVAAVSGGGGNGGSQPGGPSADTQPPATPTASFTANGSSIRGTGEAGATVRVTDSTGAVIGTGTVGADGSFTIPVNPPQTNGQPVTVVQSDAAGNVSPPATTAAPDITPPATPTATITGDGRTVSGTGEPGATVTVRDAAGQVLGTAVVGAQGGYTLTLTTPQANGGTLTVTQADPAGNVSPAATLTAPDTTPPVAPTASINGDGTSVSGTGEAGATVTVRNAAGQVLGTAVVDAQGGFTLPLTTPQANGGTLTVTQSDPAGNVSPAVTLAAPDITPPAAPTASINGDGTSVSGTGEAGATVAVRDAAGQVLGTAVVDAQGGYTLPLTTPQANGGTLTVTQADPAGNTSPAVTLAAPDITPPAAPAATLSADGATVTGSGEPGATVRVVGPDGQPIGTAIVAADGSYTVTLTTAQTGGGVLVVTQTDAAGNVSPTTQLDAIDTGPMPLPTAQIDSQGTTVSGTGEPGATVIVRDANGQAIGQATVDANGNYSLTLTTPQGNGETLTVVQSDALGNVSPTITLTAPDFTDPAAPTATIADDGSAITGTGEPGATVTVRDPAGQPLGTATVDVQGSYTLPLSTPQTNGEALSVTQSDPAGNTSPAISVGAPDTTVPAAPTATVAGDGSAIIGTGEPGATVTVSDATGQPLGTATVDAQGNYTLPLTTPQANGETLTVTQSDPAGNTSPTTTISAPDITAPTAPTATIAGEGTAITGTGEPGATVTVSDATGQPLGTATVDAQGNYTLPLTTPQANGETLTVTQSDPAGNTSPATTISAPDITAPTAPTATIAGDGTAITGTGEPGATVTVNDATGQPLGTATVDAQGNYTLPLTTPQANGETLTVTQSDPAGNTSPTTTISAPDITAPTAPVVTVSADGTQLTGTGEPGATVQVVDAGGQPVGTATVGSDGSFGVALPTGVANGQTLSAIQTDAAGNTSPASVAVTPDLVAPSAPVGTVGADGTSISGTGEPGATLIVRAPDNSVLATVTVAADGSFNAPLTTPQANGETLSVTQTDTAGNVSPVATVTAPDITPPAPPLATLSADGTAVYGNGEPGATVQVVDTNGTPLGSAVVAADSSYTLTLNPPQISGQTLSAVQTDPAGNPSQPATVAAPDLTAPPAPIATIAADGASVTGTGEPFATVRVRAADGTVIATVTVGADGSFATPLSPPQANGEALSLDQTDRGGNLSPATPLTAPDITAPTGLTAAISGDGAIVTGSGEAGATVTIRDANGAVLGTATVAANGIYNATLTTPQTNGETLQVTQADAAGNVSAPASVLAPDTTPPLAPTGSVVDSGATLSGTGEPGATVTVRAADGTLLGSGQVAPDGSFAVTLNPAQANGQALRLVQSDAAGNASPIVAVTAPDITAPIGLTATISGDGTVVTGVGEVGATVTVRDPDGTIIGTAVVGANGSYAASLTPAQIDGETLQVTQGDAAGNVSTPATVAAPDLTAPLAPQGTVSADGTLVNGTGEPGATVTVRDVNGQPLGTATVAADGSFSVPLASAQLNGQALSVVQADAAGNVSPPLALTALDTTAPIGLTASVDTTGTIVSGQAEAGATVTVRAPDGTIIGTGTAGATGAYALTLTTAQLNGQVLAVTQADAAGNTSPPSPATAPDLTAPLAPVFTLDGTGANATGSGEVGAIVTLRDASGTVIGTGQVGADGGFSVPLNPAQANGGTVSATLTDAAGNVSTPTSVAAPDITPPAPPVAVLDATGTIVSGQGEVGATVTVRDAGGGVLGTGIVGPQGSYTVTLSAPQLDAQVLSVTQADGAGNGSPATTVTALDRTAPDAPVATVSTDGTVVSGTGEIGATVTITDPVGLILATVPVNPDGSFSVTLTTALTNGQVLTLTQADAAGNVSAPGNATAPDLIPNDTPDGPTATIALDGASVSGSGQVGAAVIVRDANGAVIGNAQVAGDGSYTATLTTPQRNGETVRVTQTDAEGDVSPPATVIAPDLTAPNAPIAMIDPTGALVMGTGEVGATVRVLDANGSTLGTATVGANRAYAVTLATPQVDGQPLTVVQSDAAGNASPASPVLAPDLTAPLAPVGTVSGDGSTLTGTGEVGATVTIRSVGGAVLGTAVVDTNGNFTAPLTPAQANGQIVTLTQADAAGNVSPLSQVTAPDITAPIGLTAAINGAGNLVTGAGEAGATVTIRDAGGAVLGTAVVAANGTYAAILTPAQLNAQVLQVTQADAAGNASTPATVVAPDLTAPLAPIGTVSGDGSTLTGTGEVGATVTIRGTGGAVLGTAVVDANGNFTAPLTPAQANGQIVTLTQADAAGNISPIAQATAPDITAPAGLTAAINGIGTLVTGQGEAGATVTVRDAGGNPIGTAIVASNGSYTVTLTSPQANGQTLTVTQADAAGNASAPSPLTAPDITPPALPGATINGTGTIVTGSGEPGATVRILGAQGQLVGSAIVDANGAYTATLTIAQANGQALTVTQVDAAGNVSPQAPLAAPDITPPAIPTAAINGTGTIVTGTGEAGTTVEVRNTGGTVIGTGTVAGGGTYSVTLTTPQVAGETLNVGLRDGAGNVSGTVEVVAPFDISAFDNVASAQVDLVPVQTNETLGNANYTALVSLGLVNLDAQVLAIPNVQFTVQQGHVLDATFTYDATLSLGVASDYSVVLQRFDGTNWVAVNGGGNSPLLEVSLLGGNLVATADDLAPGQYRAFVTFDNTLGIGLLGGLSVTGVDSDFTDIGQVVPAVTNGNVITDPGPTGQVDVVSPQTRVESVTLNGVTTAVTGNTQVVGQWGTLTIGSDGRYSYTPNADAAVLGKTDRFTYTLLDASDGERESATLTISIGSPDITGAPIAVNDAATAGATFVNVVETIPATVDTSFATPTAIALTGTRTGQVTDSFTVDANSVANVTLTAAIAPGLSVVPSYTITVTNAAGAVVGTASGTALAGVGGLIGSGISVTMTGLPSGTYNYTVTSTNTLGLGYTTNVYVAETVTHLDQFALSGTTPVNGDLLANDTLGSDFLGIKMLVGGEFVDVGDAGRTLTGAYGTLTVNEVGQYSYQPFANLAYAATDPIDRFTYQIVQPDGQVSTARLDVAIDINNGVAPVFPATLTAFALEEPVQVHSDVVPMTLAVGHDAVPLTLDQADARIALSPMDDQGSVEDVLSRYLDAQSPAGEPLPSESLADAGDSSVMPSVSDIGAQDPVTHDPLGYLTVSADPEQERLATLHLV